MICVVSHDAGGAEIVASYVAQRNLACMFVLEGPAGKVFERRMGSVGIASLDEAIATCDWLLCGASWQSDIEWRSAEVGPGCAKRAVAFRGHWRSYRQRVMRHCLA